MVCSVFAQNDLSTAVGIYGMVHRNMTTVVRGVCQDYD